MAPSILSDGFKGRVLQSIDRLIARLVNIVIVVLFLAMLVLAAMQMVLRYTFDSGIVWADPAARTLVLWVGFLGAILAIGENQHFRLDILMRFLPLSVQTWFVRLSNMFGAVICFLLARASTSFLGFEADTTTFLNLPLVVVDIIIPCGFYIMMARFGVRAVTTIEPPVSAESGQKEGAG